VGVAASKADARGTDELLAALADPTRRRIVELLGEAPRTAGEIHRTFPIAAPAVSRHLRVLRDAGLITARSVPGDDRVRLYTLEQQRLDAVAAWITGVSRHWEQRLESFKEYVVNPTKGKQWRPPTTPSPDSISRR
jgi:DNA-binding transcriptional ArsR family regulator